MATNTSLLSRYAPQILTANLLAQSAIIVTGAVVRVTGSGLGCPTWPECVPGSFTPTAHQAETWHKYIEFGNRTLTFVLAAVAVLVVLAIRQTTEKQHLRRLAWVPLGGTLLQVAIGGVTVLTNLHSITVMVHLLVSIALVGYSIELRQRLRYRETAAASRLSAIAGRSVQHTALLVVILGSVVTGSGPHSGDDEVASALPFDPRVTAWIHADVVWLFVGLIIAGWFLQAAGQLPKTVRPSLRALSLLTMAQAAIGYTQYFTGLPVLLVALHVAGAVSVWIAAYTFGWYCRRLPLND